METHEPLRYVAGALAFVAGALAFIAGALAFVAVSRWATFRIRQAVVIAALGVCQLLRRRVIRRPPPTRYCDSDEEAPFEKED